MDLVDAQKLDWCVGLWACLAVLCRCPGIARPGDELRCGGSSGILQIFHGLGGGSQAQLGLEAQFVPGCHRAFAEEIFSDRLTFAFEILISPLVSEKTLATGPQ